MQFQQSYGASGDQSRKVAAGAAADFVNFSVEPDVTRLVDAGLVDASWNTGAHKGIPFGSVVTIVVRKGNPKGIKDWDDLLKPGVEVVTPNPFSSGSAKWNLLAPYSAKSNGGADKAAGLAYIDKLVTEHVKIQPKSGREATEAFLQGTGDVLLSYENEALFVEKNGDPVEHVTPPTTFKIENPAAVLKGSKNLAKAQGVQRLPVHARGPEAARRGRVPPGRPDRRHRVRLEVPRPDQALDHRRPRRLEDGRQQRSSRRTSATSPTSTTRPRSDHRHRSSSATTWRPGRRADVDTAGDAAGAGGGSTGSRSSRGALADRLGGGAAPPPVGPDPVRRVGALRTARRRDRHPVAQHHRAAAARGSDRSPPSTRAWPVSGMPSPRPPPSPPCGSPCSSRPSSPSSTR